jgi:hypothetical protein
MILKTVYKYFISLKPSILTLQEVIKTQEIPEAIDPVIFKRLFRKFIFDLN